MELLKEVKDHVLQTSSTKAKVHFRVFEYNPGALEMYHTNKYQPFIKNLNNRLQQYLSYLVTVKDISIHPINTKDQPYDMLSKALKMKLLTKC